MNELKAVLMGIDRGNFDIEESLEELELLVCTLDIKPVERVIQRRRNPDPRGYLGKGKLKKLVEIVEETGADLVVADDELSPVQAKNLEELTKASVLDRTQVILEIFARHATTDEGKIQVELARLQYELPRIVGMGEKLSRLGGGIGTRGPGEQLLEQRRREIKKRISNLKKRLKEIDTERRVQRRRRLESGYYNVSIVGYTNAGKSSLLNLLTGKNDAKVEDKLFATLEPITRRFRLPSGRTVLLNDTVGFIRKLPHTIIAAFKATLEEINESDLLVHIVDISDPYYKNKIEESIRVLEEIGARRIPRILVFNKLDLVPKSRVEAVMEEFPHAVFMSVEKRFGLGELVGKMEEELSRMEKELVLEVPQDRLGLIYSNLGKVVLEDQLFHDGYVKMRLRGRAEILKEIAGKLGGDLT